MASIDKKALTELLENGPNRTVVVSKELTLAFAGLYLAKTTLKAKPLLVWETESGYPRYYVPTESLHESIKAQLGASTSGTDGSKSDETSKLKTIDTIKTNNGSEAVIERLSIGPRSTTWVRFTKGPSAGFVRFERQELDQWFENGAIFAGIRNPYKRIETKPVARHFVVKVDGQEVAESNAAVQLSETGLKDAYYLPATSIKDWGMMEKGDLKTQCPYKGEASYYHLNVNGKKRDNAIWYYPYPTHESAGVEGFISFYNREGTDILVDGVKV